jgi:hypothetical protein
MNERVRKSILVTLLTIFVLGCIVLCVGAGYLIAIAEAYRHNAGDYVIVNSFGKVEFKWWDEMERDEQTLLDEVK